MMEREGRESQSQKERERKSIVKSDRSEAVRYGWGIISPLLLLKPQHGQ